MKTSVIFAIILLAAVFASGQNQNEQVIEVMQPEFLGIENTVAKLGEHSGSINSYLMENIVYPYNAASCRIKGTEVVKFTVTTEGELCDFKIVNCVCPDLDNEVIRVLKTTNGQWKPGLENSKPVAMEKEISVAFILSTKNVFISKAKQYLYRGNKLMYVKNNPEKALKYYNKAINHLPNEESLLIARILCKNQIGDEDGAQEDWNRLKLFTENNVQNVNHENYADLNETMEINYASKK